MCHAHEGLQPDLHPTRQVGNLTYTPPRRRPTAVRQGANNRVGGGVTAPVLSHHRTYSSYPAVSVNVVTANTSPEDSLGLEPGTRRCPCLPGRRGCEPSATSLCHSPRSSSSGPRERPGRAGKP